MLSNIFNLSGQNTVTPDLARNMERIRETRPNSKLDHKGIQIAQDRRGLDAIASKGLKEAVVLVVAARDSALLEHVSWLQEATRFVGTVESYDQAIALFANEPNLPRLLIVDIDVFDNIAVDIDRMLNFRRQVPGVSVVIASTDFARHDFSVERAPVADVSLKLPVSRVALTLGLGVAFSNMSSRAAFGRPA